MHPSRLARIFDYVPLSLDHLQNQNRKSPTRFARDCPGRTGWQAAQLSELSPRGRRLRTSPSDHSWLSRIGTLACPPTAKLRLSIRRIVDALHINRDRRLFRSWAV